MFGAKENKEKGITKIKLIDGSVMACRVPMPITYKDIGGYYFLLVNPEGGVLSGGSLDDILINIDKIVVMDNV